MKLDLDRLFRLMMAVAAAGILMLLGAEIQKLELTRQGWVPIEEQAVREYDAAGVPRFRITHRDTLDDGLVVRVVEDMIWHEIVLHATWNGTEYLRVTVVR